MVRAGAASARGLAASKLKRRSASRRLRLRTPNAHGVRTPGDSATHAGPCRPTSRLGSRAHAEGGGVARVAMRDAAPRVVTPVSGLMHVAPQPVCVVRRCQTAAAPIKESHACYACHLCRRLRGPRRRTPPATPLAAGPAWARALTPLQRSSPTPLQPQLERLLTTPCSNPGFCRALSSSMPRNFHRYSERFQRGGGRVKTWPGHAGL